MENKRKIVYLLPGGLFNSGGMERVITTKANYLAETVGYDVSIVTTEQMGRPVFYPLSSKIKLYHLNIGIHENFGKEFYLQKIISRFFKTKEYKRELSRLLLKLRPDITISTLGLDIGFINDIQDGSLKIGELHFPGNFRQLMANKLSKDFLSNYIAKLRTQELKDKCAKLDRLVVLTNEEKNSWDKKDNIVVIPNPLPFRSDKTSTCENKRAIAVGRLVYEKGFDWMIEIWEAVMSKHSDWVLDIYGSGDEKENLLKLVEDRGLKGYVNIKDPVSDIQNRYLEYSMLLFTSRYLDALPMVLLEAMECGLPLVSFDAPCGPKDVIVNGENGFLIKAGDIDKMVLRICELIESPELRKNMGKGASEKAKKYEVENIMKQWIDIFNSK